MQRLLRSIFNLNSIYLAIPVLLLLVYGPGAVLAFDRLGLTQEVTEFLSIFIVSICLYFGFYFLTKILLNNKKLVIHNGISIVLLSKICFLFYGIYMVYVVITAPKVPLIQSFLGMPASELAFYREAFFKARTGIDSILVYINAILTVAVLPYIIANLYLIKYKYRHLFLLFFIFTLMLSMEKSLITRAIVPLLVLVVNRKLVDKYLTLKNIILVLCVGLAGVTLLALGRLSNQGAIIEEVVDFDPATARYFIFSNPDNAFLFMVNRVFWIPYVTAIDWLSYFNQELHRNFVMGASSSLISGIFGIERVNLERLVFEFEWGQNETGTGSANTVYFIDIFLNFGWVGVVISNIILAFIVNFFEFCNSDAAKASFFVFAYFIITSSLMAVLFSSGLLLLMFLMLCVKNR